MLLTPVHGYLQFRQYLVGELLLHASWCPMATAAGLTHGDSDFWAHKGEGQSTESKSFDSLRAQPAGLEPIAEAPALLRTLLVNKHPSSR